MKKVSAAELVSLSALRSVCIPGQGRLSEIFVEGTSFHDPRRICSLLEALARHFALDLAALRQRCGGLLNRRNYLPLPFNSQLVLVPLTLGQLGEKTGYVNLLALERVLPEGRNSRILLKHGIELLCWLAPETVGERLVQARYLLFELAAGGLLPSPGSEQIWQKKLEIIRAIFD